ncbi:MAG: preprotein translocase subunit SecY [Clostridia bacterium]|nr:preprotein translocase subunit SecY [Clostridia bacterium]
MGLWSIIVKSLKEPTIRKKIFMTLLLILIFRVGCFIPVPGVSSGMLSNLAGSGLGQFWDLLSGGAMTNVSLFSMGIQPYINASIIIQLLTVAIPAFERWQKEGPEGRKRLSKVTKYTAVALALFQAIMLCINMSSNSDTTLSWIFGEAFMGKALLYIIITVSFVAGACFLTWLGDKITEVGIGNGISMIIFAGIISRGPEWIGELIQIAISGEYSVNGQTPTEVAKPLYLRIPLVVLVVAVFIAVIVAVVWMESGERRLGVVYSQRITGRKVMGGQKSYIPLKVNSAGVLPIIFAMSLLQFPITIVSLVKAWSGAAAALQEFSKTWWHILIYAVLIIGFTFFYNMVYFDPKEYANNIIQNGGSLTEKKTNSRKETAKYIGGIQNKLTWFGSFFLAILAILPSVLGKICDLIPGINTSNLNLWLGGTSILIMVGVALETVKSLETQLMMRHYKAGKGGFLG